MFLPTNKDDMKKAGISCLDFVFVTGDAYVDHSSFAHAILSRLLEKHGYSVGIIPQPNPHSIEAFTVLGEPRLGFLVSAGNIDSMVNHYTSSKKRRHQDQYSPGGKAGLRPDRATIVYCNKIREAFGKRKPIIIGGIEASLRRFAHYDYWSDKVRRNILTDSGANLLIYGMGEHQIIELADLLNCGADIKDIKHIAGTVYEENEANLPDDCIILPSYDEVSTDKTSYARATAIMQREQDSIRGKILVQKDSKKFIVQNPPSPPLSKEELDEVYELPYEYAWHPMYDNIGGIPAFSEIKFSLTSSRGCFGSCNFCALAFHQGRSVTSRSHDSLIREAKKLTSLPDFKGYIHDVGGPTANFRQSACQKQKKYGVCPDRQCLFPTPCQNLDISHKDYLALLRKIREIPEIKKVFIRSGIRYDYLLADKDEEFFYELCKYHISGQLRIAPEHISDNVLMHMGKPKRDVYDKFIKRFNSINQELNMEQYAVPYLMSSHPGSTLKDAIKLAEFLKERNMQPDQVQDFYPTPGSISTCMYYTGLDPFTMKKVYVPRTYEERQMQRALLQFRNPQNYEIVKKALIKAGRSDLIGYSAHCLIKPKGDYKNGRNSQRKGNIRKGKIKTNGKDKSSFGKRNNPGTGSHNSRE